MIRPINPLMPVGNYSYQFFICCPRDCVSRHNGGASGAPLKPLRVDSALRALSSLRGLRGAPEVPPLCRETQSLGQQMWGKDCGPQDLREKKTTKSRSYCLLCIVLADCIYNIPKIHGPKKLLFKSGQIYRKDAHCCSENDILVNEFFFVRLLVFGLWSFLYMVDFGIFDLMFTKDLRDFCEPDSDANQWG